MFAERYVRKNFNPDAKGLAGLQWDSADLYKVCLYIVIIILTFSCLLSTVALYKT